MLLLKIQYYSYIATVYHIRTEKTTAKKEKPQG
jgi:hypothetical protein